MSESPTVYLFRHGESANNVQSDLIFGQSGHLPLTAIGEEQAYRLGRALKYKGIIPDVVYSSGATRAEQTGRIALDALGLDIDVPEDDRLHEQSTGDWTGRIASEVFTPTMIETIEASGKDFRSPNGESMNDVGERMLNWLEDVANDLESSVETIFAFTHGGAIRSLASYLGGWNHARTYGTKPMNASATVLSKTNGVWTPQCIGIDAKELPSQMNIPSEMSLRLSENEMIHDHLKSVLWFGSIRNKQDVHKESDFDVQIVLDNPDTELTVELNNILVDYPDVDLSIMYMKDIFDKKGNVIFHDGTKGLFFMHVLAAGKVLHGKNIYADIVGQLTLDDVRPSLSVTIREYLSRLRVMAAQSPENTLQFRKYSLKLFKDLLIYDGAVPINQITKLNNGLAKQNILAKRVVSAEATDALTAIDSYDQPFSQRQMAALLSEYEVMVEELCND